MRIAPLSQWEVGPTPLIFTMMLGAFVGWAVNARPSFATSPPLASSVRTDAVSRIARERAQSVVLLHSIGRSVPTGPGSNWLLQPVREGLGSGIVIDSQGLILTNAHVLDTPGVLHVRRPDGEDLETTVVGIDPDSDLALVRVANGAGLAAAPLGDSDRVEVGSFVVAIGSPLGLDHTVTTGVLSGKARGLDDSGLEFLQTDAAVNPGSSGGPLLDLSGRVIGVITAIASAGGGNVGLNFAIPINTVKEELPALRTNSVTHAWLGMTTVGLTPTGANALGLSSAREGLLINNVEVDGPAARGGVQTSDVLLGLAGDTPARASEVYRRIRTMAPGSTIHLRLLRDGHRIDRTVVLGARPAGR